MKNKGLGFAVAVVVGGLAVAGMIWSGWEKEEKMRDVDGNNPKQNEIIENTETPHQYPCATDISEFVQITTMQLDAGEQTFEACRISRSGRVEWARWNSSGFLLTHAQPIDMGSETFDRVVSSSAFLKPSELHRDDGTLGRPGSRIDVVSVSKSGVDIISMAKMPDDIVALIEKIKSGAEAVPVPPGWYIWTKPYPPADRVDIDLTKATCETAVERALSDSIAYGRLIVRTDDTVQEFVSGENAYRSAFSARMAVGDLLFGIVSAR